MTTPMKTVRRVIEHLHYLQKMFGAPPYPGLAMLEKHIEGDPWMTIQEITERSETSEDTVRRRVVDLVSSGRAEEDEVDGRRLYRITDRCAKMVVDGLASNQVKADARNQ